VAEEASEKEWQRSKFSEANSERKKFRAPQQGTFTSAAGGRGSERKGVAAVEILRSEQRAKKFRAPQQVLYAV